MTILSINVSYGQFIERLENCNCIDKIDQNEPVLNGNYERTYSGKLIEKGEFINGVKNGEWITYSKKGSLIRKYNYVNGALNGKVELYYLDGKPKLIGEFENGNKIGKWTYYTNKGKVRIEGEYESNKPIGIWTLNDKKGKKAVTQYDFDKHLYLINNSADFLKDNSIVQNGNTEEFYILRYPQKNYYSKSEPLGGFDFANNMFIDLVEVPVNYWDTFVYNKYKINVSLQDDNSARMKFEVLKGDEPDNQNEFTFLILTNPPAKIKNIKHSQFEKELLDFKIKEALSIMPPWIKNEESEVSIYIHYVLNKNLH